MALPQRRRVCRARAFSLAFALSQPGCIAQAFAEEAPRRYAEARFNAGFLRATGKPVDIARFNTGNVVFPGKYRVDLYANRSWKGRAEIELRATDPDREEARLCFDRSLADRIGIDPARMREPLAPDGASSCQSLEALVQGASARLDSGEQRLDVSVPQEAMLREARGYVDPSLWNDGVPALLLAYNANVYRNDSDHYSNTSAYLGLDGGINYGPWRLRYSGSVTNSSGSGTRFQSIRTVLQRSIVSLKSQLTLGDGYTNGRVYDSIGFRGIQLSSDERMLPQSLRGYAPVVSGTAHTNARVQVWQGRNLMQEITVAPGRFEIDDVFPTGYGGDLEVRIIESDGSVRISRVPFSAPVNSVRQGQVRYDLTAGQYRNGGNDDDRPWIGQGTLQYGISNLLTGYGGVAVSEGYYSAQGGAGLNTAFGAIGLDLTYAATRFDKRTDLDGQSVRLSYSRLFAPTATNVTIAGYRYSSKGYLDMAEAIQMREAEKLIVTADPLADVPRTRGRFTATVNQQLAEGWGNLYLSGSTQDYWNRSERDTQFQFGYTNGLGRLAYTLSAGRSFNPASGTWENQAMLSFSLPLEWGSNQSSGRSHYLNASVQRQSGQATSVTASVSGSAGEDNALSYSIGATHTGQANGVDGDTALLASASYASPYAVLNGTFSLSETSTQISAGASGGVVAYGGGVVLTPRMSETTVIVEADDAVGARLTNGSGLRIDPWGRAVVAGLAPFASSAIEIDPKGLPVNVELMATQLRTAPTSGAVVPLRFETTNPGRWALFRIRLPDGTTAPFGAEVLDAKESVLGVVAQNGRVIARGLHDKGGRLTVRWGGGLDEACAGTYALLPDAPENSLPLRETILTCERRAP